MDSNVKFVLISGAKKNDALRATACCAHRK